MDHSPPAEVGMKLEEVDTPALLVDLDAFEHNLDLMAKTVRTAGLRLRPHAKTHKCAPIALQQMARGAVGVCCQKVSEAEALVAGGVTDVLVTNEIVDPRKIVRLAKLAHDARIGVCVDDLNIVEQLGKAARAQKVVLDIYIEVDVGGERCGVPPNERLIEYSARIAAFESLRFRGIHAYQGRAQHIRSIEDRGRAIADSTSKARMAVEILARAGITCEVVTGGGTGTYDLEMQGGIYNELQPGSYIFMDADYSRNELSKASAFQQSLFIYTQIMSVPAPQMVVVDAGLKALSVDSGMPLVHEAPGVVYERASDDHGVLLSKQARQFHLGQKLKLVPGHCDPTVNLYDWFVGIRHERVEVLWPIARGTIS
jgi:3-hydroxy-D-aspartate aldolase